MAAPTMGGMVAGLAEFGERPALVSADHGELSYAELLALTHRFGDAIARLGVEPGERFAFLLPNGARIVACYCACATTGVVGVPLATRLTADELVHQLTDSGSVAVLYDDEHAALAAELAPRLPGVRRWVGAEGPSGALPFDQFIAGTSEQAPSHVPEPGDPFCVMYTGGTTGVSKAAIQTQESWGACLADTVEQLGIAAGDRHAVVLPMTHAAWFTAAAHLQAGALTHLLTKWDPVELLVLTERERLTKLHMLPTLLGDLLAAAEVRETDVSSVGLVSVAGSPIPVEMYRRAQAVFGEVICNIYGLTEASGPVTYLLPADMNEERLRSGGRAGRYCEIKIDPDGPVAEGERVTGEILLSGPQMTPGYLNRPEETAAAYRDRWFCTGDVGYLDEEGFLYIVDRKKEMVKTGGFNVYPKEVEEVLYAHPEVHEAAVFGVPDERWIEALTAAVVLTPGASASADSVRDFCRQALPAYKVPKAVHLLDALPRTNFGKFDKKALAKRYAEAELCTATTSDPNGGTR